MSDGKLSKTVIQRLLDLLAEIISMKTPKALESYDAGANVEDKISAMEDLLRLSDRQKQELTPLIRKYFALERLVHRIKYGYVTAGRVELLSRSKLSIFPHKEMQETVRPLIYSDAASTDDVDLLSALGEGAGLETDIDRFFGTDELVSMTLEAFDSLGSRPGTGFEHTGIAIVYSPGIEQDARMMAVNAPDVDYLFDRQLGQEVLDLEGIRRLRQEMILRQGQKELTSKSAGAYSQGPFDPREAMVAGGIKGKYIEAIVVDDRLFGLVYSRMPAMRAKLARASDYFKRAEDGEFENVRLQELEALRGQILGMLASPGAADDTNIPKPHVGSTEGHVNEAILRAHGQLTEGAMNSRQAAEMIIQAILTMPDSLEGIVNMPTAIGILEQAYKDTGDQRYARIGDILQQYAASDAVDEQLTAKARAIYEVSVPETPSGPGAAKTQKDNGRGGIDFSGNMPIMTQPIPGRLAVPPAISPQREVSSELIKKWQEIQRLLQADIMPSPERLREYLQDCYAGGCIDREIDKVLGCIADILRKEEERSCLTEAALKEILVALEQESSAANLSAALNKISVASGEPQIVPGS